MNRYASYPHRIPGGFGFWAMIRLCRDAHPAPVLDKGGKPIVFQTETEATKACLKHLLAYMNGHEIRGEVFETGDYTPRRLAKSQALKMFKTKDEECAA